MGEEIWGLDPGLLKLGKIQNPGLLKLGKIHSLDPGLLLTMNTNSGSCTKSLYITLLIWVKMAY
jgi:hypothetical protein